MSLSVSMLRRCRSPMHFSHRVTLTAAPSQPHFRPFSSSSPAFNKPTPPADPNASALDPKSKNSATDKHSKAEASREPSAGGKSQKSASEPKGTGKEAKPAKPSKEQNDTKYGSGEPIEGTGA